MVIDSYTYSLTHFSTSFCTAATFKELNRVCLITEEAYIHAKISIHTVNERREQQAQMKERINMAIAVLFKHNA